MLFFGFLLTVIPILIALSTQSYYDEHFYHSKNGHFKYYYSVEISNIKDINTGKWQEYANSRFMKSSVLTNEIHVPDPNFGRLQVVGLLNNRLWSPPLIEGTAIDPEDSRKIIAGKLFSDKPDKITVLGEEYVVKGIAGKNKGRDLINVYRNKVYINFNEIPESIERGIEQKQTLNIMVRSNSNPAAEIDHFLSDIRSESPEIIAKTANESKNFEAEKRSRGGVKEMMSYPYKLVVIALINCIIASYLWIHLKKREVALRKALGASNLNLFTHIMIQLLVCALLAALLAILIQLILSKMNLKILHFTSYFINYDMGQIGVAILITLVIAFMTSIIPFIHIIRIEPAKAMKE